MLELGGKNDREGDVFGWAAVLLPLKGPPAIRPENGWIAGPWPVSRGQESVSVADRRRRYHVQRPIETLTDSERRSWRDLRTAGGGVLYRAAEFLDVVASDVRRAYLVLHLDLIRGPRGGTDASFAAMAKLARLQSEGYQDFVDRLVGVGFPVDASYMRATTLVGLPQGKALPGTPPRARHPDPSLAWLVAGTDLPRPNESSYEADEREVFSIVPGVKGAVGPGGVAVLGEGGRHLRERTFRAHYVDALMLALLQRDVLLILGARLADHRRDGKATLTLKAFDQFRSEWWKPMAVDHPVSRVIGDRWRGRVGVGEFMDQMIGEVADLHAEKRTRRAERIATCSIVVASIAAIAASIDVMVG